MPARPRFGCKSHAAAFVGPMSTSWTRLAALHSITGRSAEDPDPTRRSRTRAVAGPQPVDGSRAPRATRAQVEAARTNQQVHSQTSRAVNPSTYAANRHPSPAAPRAQAKSPPFRLLSADSYPTRFRRARAHNPCWPRDMRTAVRHEAPVCHGLAWGSAGRSTVSVGSAPPAVGSPEGGGMRQLEMGIRDDIPPPAGLRICGSAR